MPRILMLSDITGLGPDYHVGDEAMAEVAIDRLSSLLGPECLILGCANPEAVPSTYSIRAFPFYHLTDKTFNKLLFKRPLSYLKSIFINVTQVLLCDKILICGGGNMTSVWPEVLESRLRLLRIANLLKKDIYLVSQTLGPFNDEHRCKTENILKKAKWIGVRDINFSKHQINAPVQFALDDACYLNPIHSKYTKEISDKANEFACVSMRKFGRMEEEDVIRIATVIEKTIAALNLNTVFIPHHAPRGTGGDIQLARSIQNIWPASRFHLVDPIPLASQLKALTGDSKFVISMRYHQLIFALSLGIPSVGIYVDEYTKAKLTGAFDAFGLSPRVLSKDNVESHLHELITDVCNRKPEFLEAARKIDFEAKVSNEKPYALIAELDNFAITDDGVNKIGIENK